MGMLKSRISRKNKNVFSLASECDDDGTSFIWSNFLVRRDKFQYVKDFTEVKATTNSLWLRESQDGFNLIREIHCIRPQGRGINLNLFAASWDWWWTASAQTYFKGNGQQQSFAGINSFTGKCDAMHLLYMNGISCSRTLVTPFAVSDGSPGSKTVGSCGEHTILILINSSGMFLRNSSIILSLGLQFFHQ